MTDVEGKATGWKAYFGDAGWREEGTAKVVKKKAATKKKTATKKKAAAKKRPAKAAPKKAAPSAGQGSPVAVDPGHVVDGDQ
jgi:DNA topoisomerase-1